MMSKLLINEPPLQVLPSLARAVGLNEAIVLQQLHYWMAHAKTQHEGRKWVYKTYEEWQTCFPFWSIRTIKSVFSGLKNSGLVCVQALSDDKWNRVNFYSVNYEKLAEVTLESSQIVDFSHSAEVAQCIVQKLHDPSCKPCTIDSAEVALSSIPENTTENTTEITAAKAKPAKATKQNPVELPDWINPEAWAGFVDMRKAIKKSLTDRAMQLAIGKLGKLRQQGQDPNACLDQSVMNGWQDVYAIKPDHTAKKQAQASKWDFLGQSQEPERDVTPFRHDTKATEPPALSWIGGHGHA